MPMFVIPFPNISPELVTFGPYSIFSLSLGPFAIRWYALSYIAGILLGWLYARAIISNQRNWGGSAPLTVTHYDDFIVWVTLGIILGGRIGYVLFYNLPHYIAHPLDMLEVWNGGMSFHGGFLGVVTAVALFSWKYKIPFFTLADVSCAVTPIGLLLGRIANFINGELWGRPTDVPWAMVFPNAGPPRHPSQLYEAATEGVLLLIILWIAIRMGALKRRGIVTGLFAIFYALFRSFCEFFREPDPQLGFLWGGLTMGMLLSVPLFLAGVAFIVWALRRTPRQT